MILYLRIRIIFWMITESSSYVLVNIFSNNSTSVRDGDSPVEVAPLRPVQSRTAVAIMQWGVDLLDNGCCCFRQLSPSCRMGKNNQSVNGECTETKTSSSSAFPISAGSNVNTPSMFFTFHPTRLLIHCGVIFFIFSFNLYAFFFCHVFYLLMGAIFLMFHTVCMDNE